MVQLKWPFPLGRCQLRWRQENNKGKGNEQHKAQIFPRVLHWARAFTIHKRDGQKKERKKERRKRKGKKRKRRKMATLMVISVSPCAPGLLTIPTTKEWEKQDRFFLFLAQKDFVAAVEKSLTPNYRPCHPRVIQLTRVTQIKATNNILYSVSLNEPYFNSEPH